MTDQELIQALRCCANGESEDCPFAGHGVCGCPGMSADLIERLTAENAALRTQLPQWIPVTERLPEEHDSIFAKAYGTKRWADGMFRTISDEVLACVAFDDGRKTTMTLRTHDGAWALSSIHRGHVTHWMPLPPAPGEEPHE